MSNIAKMQQHFCGKTVHTPRLPHPPIPWPCTHTPSHAMHPAAGHREPHKLVCPSWLTSRSSWLGGCGVCEGLHNSTYVLVGWQWAVSVHMYMCMHVFTFLDWGWVGQCSPTIYIYNLNLAGWLPPTPPAPLLQLPLTLYALIYHN